MKTVVRSDVMDIAQYEKERAAFRARIIELKRHRRVAIGDKITAVFENRETVRFQVQEMMRAERIVRDDRIQEELDTYNDLVPGANQLKPTLLIEVSESAQIQPVLDSLRGIDRGGTTYLHIGSDKVEGEYEGGRSPEIKISAVHYVTFTLTQAQSDAFIACDAPLALSVDVRDYHHRIELPPDVRASLADDLRSA